MKGADLKARQLVLGFMLIGLPAAGALGQMKMQDMNKLAIPSKSAAATHKAVGVVKKVDPAKNTVTLAHEPVKSLNWPAMTMSFAVKDKALLDQLQAGKKFEFEFVQQGKDYVITTVK